MTRPQDRTDTRDYEALANWRDRLQAIETEMQKYKVFNGDVDDAVDTALWSVRRAALGLRNAITITLNLPD